MIFVDWFHLDWMDVLPIILVTLLIIILTLRLMRRLTRWGPTDISHIGSETISFGEQLFRKYFHSIPDNQRLENFHLVDSPDSETHSIKEEMDPNSNTLNPNQISNDRLGNILVIPPISGKFDYFCQALAMNSQATYIWDNNCPDNLEFLQYHPKNNKKDMISFIKNEKINHIVIFDWAIPIFLKNFRVLNLAIPIKITAIRPIYCYSDLQSLFQIPLFTPRWFYRKKIHQILKKNHFSIQDLNVEIEDLIKNQSIHSIYVIRPENSLNTFKVELETQEKEEILNEKQWGNSIQFTSGSWSFYRQEPIVLGWIIKHHHS